MKPSGTDRRRTQVDYIKYEGSVTHSVPTFRHGLVVGKFFPPHRGHAFLVRTAAQFSERATVGVFDRPQRVLPLHIRAQAIEDVAAPFGNVTAVHAPDEVPIDYDDPTIWDKHVSIFRDAIERVGGPPVDAVFTSEAYGVELARRFQARHVEVDRDRVWEAVSGTSVRAQPATRWRDILPVARQQLARRIVVLGAESTGTTTVARDLAEDLGLTGFVQEFGRELSMQKLAVARAFYPTASMQTLDWMADDFARIARIQTATECEFARGDNPVVVCDTDALATQVWHERYRGGAHPQVAETMATLAPLRCYLVTHHDGVPFEDDGLRDGAHLRAWMTGRFVSVLAEHGARYHVLTGTREQRRTQARAIASAFMAEPWPWSGDP